MNAGERIKVLRKSLGLTQQEFSDRLGIKRNTITNYEIGRNEPIDAVFNLICKTWNVNPEWLKEGEGDMYLPSSKDVLEQYCKDNELPKETAIFLREFAKLPSDQQENIIHFILKVAGEIRDEDHSYTEEDYEKDLGITAKEKSTTSNISEGEKTA